MSCPDGCCSPYLPPFDLGGLRGQPLPILLWLYSDSSCVITGGTRSALTPVCYGLSRVPRHLHFEALTPVSTDIDCIWSQGL